MKQAIKFLRRAARRSHKFLALLKLVEKGVLVPVAQSHREIRTQGLVLRDQSWTLAVSPSGQVEGYYKGRPTRMYHWVEGDEALHLCRPSRREPRPGSLAVWREPVDKRLGRILEALPPFVE